MANARLIYARTRYADDDYRRAERQQQVVTALMSKLINPLHWPAVIIALQSVGGYKSEFVGYVNSCAACDCECGWRTTGD